MATATKKKITAPHRPLMLTAPYTRGNDVKALQRKVGTTPDGEYGPKTQRAVRRKLWTLGCSTGNLDNGATIGYQRIILGLTARPASWTKTAKIRARMAASAGGEAQAVLAWAESKLGMTETGAYNSNRGPQIDVWQREVGMIAQPWCGAFVVYGLRHVANIVVPSDWRYTPNILIAAKAGQYGFGFSSVARPGSLCLMDFKPGGDPVMHVGFCKAGRQNIEGNTSPGAEGSQDEGGCVALRTRSPWEIVGYAHPPYGK